jgi:RNA polymerase subunit RPABC4/transcription elongation factor Spt4
MYTHIPRRPHLENDEFGIRVDTAKKIITPKTVKVFYEVMRDLELRPSTFLPLRGSSVIRGGLTEKMEKPKKHCMHCNALMHSEDKVCPNCGRSPMAGVDTKVCNNCKSVIPLAAKFCSECGAIPEEKKQGNTWLKAKMNTVQENVNIFLSELENGIQRAQQDNQGECNIQKAFSIILFVFGMSLIATGFLLNQYVVLAFGTMFEFLIAWPYKNLTKIKNESIFLSCLVPRIKADVAQCDLLENEKDRRDCYRQGFKKFDSWMGKLERKAFG